MLRQSNQITPNQIKPSHSIVVHARGTDVQNLRVPVQPPAAAAALGASLWLLLLLLLLPPQRILLGRLVEEVLKKPRDGRGGDGVLGSTYGSGDGVVVGIGTG